MWAQTRARSLDMFRFRVLVLGSGYMVFGSGWVHGVRFQVFIRLWDGRACAHTCTYACVYVCWADEPGHIHVLMHVCTRVGRTSLHIHVHMHVAVGLRLLGVRFER